jgi:hypothetical protein
MKTLFAILFIIVTCLNPAISINAYLYSPSQHTTIDEGQSITFNIGADDPVGLDFSEWYILPVTVCSCDVFCHNRFSNPLCRINKN